MPELPLHTRRQWRRMVWDEAQPPGAAFTLFYYSLSPPPCLFLSSSLSSLSGFYLPFICPSLSLPWNCISFACFSLPSFFFFSPLLKHDSDVEKKPSVSPLLTYQPPLLVCPSPPALSGPLVPSSNTAVTAWGLALVKSTKAPKGQLRIVFSEAASYFVSLGNCVPSTPVSDYLLSL